MDTQTFSVGFGLPSAESSTDELWIEQEDISKTDGYLSRSAMYLAIWALLENGEPKAATCITDVSIDLYVYRTNLSMAYGFYSSYGVLSAKTPQIDYSFTESIKFQMTDEEGLRLPNFGIIAYRWIADAVWDAEGSPTSAPAVTFTSRKAKTSGKVYGTLQVTYKVNRDKYTLDLPKREDTEENKYSSVAYATHKGGPTWKILTVPTNAENEDAMCKGGLGGSTTISPPDDDIPVAPNIDAETIIDYCTNEVTSETP